MKPTLDNTIGAIFLGVVGASILFGVTTLQTLWYYHAYPNDTKIHRCSVGLLWFLDALHLAVCLHAVYSYVINGFGKIYGSSLIIWSVQVQCAINIVVILIVQCLYASRVWLVGGFHHAFFKYTVILIVGGGFGIGITLASLTFTIHEFSELGKIAWAIEAGLAAATAIDFVITGSMCYYLRKSKGTITLLNSRISVIIHYTLSSGLLTSACSLATMFSLILLPNTFVFLALEFILEKFYVNSFIAMLNCRERKTSSIEQFNTAIITIPSWERPDDVGLSSKLDSQTQIGRLGNIRESRINMSPIQLLDRSQSHES